jgi:hypothetical protein
MLLVIGPENWTHVPSAASRTAGCSSVLPTNIFTQMWQPAFSPCDFKKNIISLLSHMHVLVIVEGFRFRFLTLVHILVRLEFNHVDKVA